MGRKKLIYLQLYVKDYTGDERLRWCSPSAWGVYSYLLCLLNSTEPRGALQMSKLEQRPHLKKSLTQRVLYATTDRQRLAPFAELLQRQMPWKRAEILKALRELAQYRVIVIQGDMLIQPRMYRESGNKLDSIPAAPTAPVLNGSPAEKKTTPPKKPKPKPTKPTASDSTPAKKTPPSVPFDTFWDAYDKKVCRPKCEKLYAALSDADREAIMQHIPLYKEAEPNKKFRKNPETYLRNHSWEDEIISDNTPQPKRKNDTVISKEDISKEDVETW